MTGGLTPIRMTGEVQGMAESVVVIGSGASGLGAAFRLQQAGHQVRILEASDYVGGKMRTVHRDGFLVEEGPSIMSRGYHNILGVVRDAGLAGEMVDAGSVFGFPRGDEIHYIDSNRILRDSARSGMLSARGKLAMSKLFVDCLRHRKALETGQIATLGALDSQGADEYALRRVGREVLDYMVDPAVRALAGSSARDLSAADVLYCFNNFIEARKFVAFRAGMTSYAEAMAARFDVTRSAEVLSVREQGGGVSVVWRDRDGTDHTEDFAAAVVAGSAHRNRAMLPDLDEWRAQFLADVRYTPIVNAAVAVSTPPPNAPACYILMPEKVSKELIVLGLEHNKAPGRAPEGKGLIGIYASPEWSRELYDLDDDVCITKMIDVAERFLPGLSSTVEFSNVSRWDPTVLQSPAGYWTRLARFTEISAQRDRRIQLAGDYLCTSNINSATAAGERAAARILACF